MKKGLKIGALIILLLILLSGSYFLYIKEYINYLIITGTLSVIVLIILIDTILKNRSEESIYNSKVKRILKTYDYILVKSKNIPNLDEKNIITVDSMEDMVDAQMEIRKPIYYQQHEYSCSFVLLDNNEACVHIIKLNDSIVSPLEIKINEIEIKRQRDKEKEDDDNVSEEVLDDIDKTTILRVNKGKYVKVSPIRRKKENQAKEQNKDDEEKIATLITDFKDKEVNIADEIKTEDKDEAKDKDENEVLK